MFGLLDILSWSLSLSLSLSLRLSLSLSSRGHQWIVRVMSFRNMYGPSENRHNFRFFQTFEEDDLRIGHLSVWKPTGWEIHSKGCWLQNEPQSQRVKSLHVPEKNWDNQPWTHQRPLCQVDNLSRSAMGLRMDFQLNCAEEQKHCIF